MPEKNTERKIHLRFSEDLHWRLRIRCVPLDTTIQHFVVEQLERELSASVSGRRGPEASTHAKPSTRSRNVAQKGDDRACFHFVSDLDEVAAKIAKLTNTDPARAVALYETFLAGCHEKAEEVNDSSGSLGQFVDELFCGWIKARQAACADPDETAPRLLGWMDDDPYEFCCHLEKDAVKVFDKAGLAAFAKLVRAHFEGAARTKPTADGSFKDRPEYIRRRWGEALPMLYLAQENIEAYVALAEETGIIAQNCHAIATLLVTRRKPEEALAWVERGISLDKKTPHGVMAGHDLAKLKCELLTKLGRGLTARCRRENGPEHVASVSDVLLLQRSGGARCVAAYRKWLGLEPFPPEVVPTARRKRKHKVAATDLDLSGPVELVALSIKENAARYRLLGSDPRHHTPCEPALGPGSRPDRRGQAAQAVEQCGPPFSFGRDRVSAARCCCPGFGAAEARGPGHLDPRRALLGRGGRANRRVGQADHRPRTQAGVRNGTGRAREGCR